MMKTNTLFRVVSTRVDGRRRIDHDIGCQWKTEHEARLEMMDLALRGGHKRLALQKKE